MRFYVRIIRDAGPETYSDGELRALRQQIASAPSVTEVLVVEKHVRGGYAVVVTLAGTSAEAFGAWLIASGYRLVV